MKLDERMKPYEMAEAGRRLMPLLPVLARLDGRAFHTFCRGMAKPYDSSMVSAMVATTQHLLEDTDALLGYTQSDEITLLWHSTDIKSEIFFAGRIQKMTSVLASLASVYFNREMDTGSRPHPPVFDCRVWNVPTRREAYNAILWREQDATRNSIEAAGQARFSHKQLFGKHSSQVQDMLMQEGINWNDYPACFKRGTYLRRVLVKTPFTAEEIERLPPKHEARMNPGLIVERHVIRETDMRLGQVVNWEETLFDGAEPEHAMTETETLHP